MRPGSSDVDGMSASMTLRKRSSRLSRFAPRVAAAGGVDGQPDAVGQVGGVAGQRRALGQQVGGGRGLLGGRLAGRDHGQVGELAGRGDRLGKLLRRAVLQVERVGVRVTHEVRRRADLLDERQQQVGRLGVGAVHVLGAGRAQVGQRLDLGPHLGPPFLGAQGGAEPCVGCRRGLDRPAEVLPRHGLAGDGGGLRVDQCDLDRQQHAQVLDALLFQVGEPGLFVCRLPHQSEQDGHRQQDGDR